VDDLFWLDPRRITHKISGAAQLVGIQPGDWDLERAHPLRDTAKFRAVAAHVLDGVAWLDTELFQDVYARRLAEDGHVGGIRTLPALARWYDSRFARLLTSMRRHGFTLESDGRRHPLPSLLIGRDGTVFIGNQGNHRLALAQVLGLDRFAGRITCRHPKSSS
jgi:hypothetical protein